MAFKVKQWGTNSNNWANFGLFLHFLMVLGLKTLLFDISYLSDGSGQNFTETRQDETISRDKKQIQDKARQKRCMSRQDKTQMFSEMQIRDKTRLSTISNFRDKTGQDSMSCLVLAGNSRQEISRPITGFWCSILQLMLYILMWKK